MLQRYQGQRQRHLDELHAAAHRRGLGEDVVAEAHMDPVLAYMIKHDMPLTRDKWISMNWPDGVPHPWTAEDEGQLPEMFQHR